MANTKTYSEDELRDACEKALLPAVGKLGIDMRSFGDPFVMERAAEYLGVEKDSIAWPDTLKDAERMLIEIWGELEDG